MYAEDDFDPAVFDAVTEATRPEGLLDLAFRRLTPAVGFNHFGRYPNMNPSVWELKYLGWTGGVECVHQTSLNLKHGTRQSTEPLTPLGE